jgi:hypothetical protein
MNVPQPFFCETDGDTEALVGLNAVGRRMAASMDFDFMRQISMRMGQAVTSLARQTDAGLGLGTKPVPLFEGLRVLSFPRHDLTLAGYLGTADSYEALRDDTEDIGVAFESLASRWIEETQFESSLLRTFSNESYLEILGLGPRIIPYLLQRLRSEPERWVGALKAISRADIGSEAATPDEAVSAWTDWGRSHHYVT